MPAIDALAADLRVTKRTPGAFTETCLDEWLRAQFVTQVVVAGLATGTGVEATARQAYELGYDVALATDAMTDMDAAVHENSVRRIFPRIGESGTVREIVTLLEQARS